MGGSVLRDGYWTALSACPSATSCGTAGHPDHLRPDDRLHVLTFVGSGVT